MTARSLLKNAWLVSAAAIAIMLLAAPAGHAAGPSVTPQDLIVEPPTLIALGFEWNVDGDDNGDASVTVSYRKKGARDWRGALPLLRRNREDYSSQYGPPVAPGDRPNLFVGSIFDLEPDTEYEAKFVMSDPDGVSGEREKIVVARTRAEPVPAPGGRVFHVYPPDWKGVVTQPAYIGVLAAYLDGPTPTADHYNVYPPRVQPGDTILVHAGLYKDDHLYYAQGTGAVPNGIPPNATCCGATFHGTYHLVASGTAEKPIVIKSAGDGEAIFDGDGNAVLFNVQAGNYTHFEGLTFRNTQVAIEAGQKGIAGAVGITVKKSKFENVGEGVHTDWAGSKNFYITDNVFIGRHNPDKLVPFSLGFGGGSPMRDRLTALGVTREATQMTSQYAVKVYGSGNVVAYNRIRNFHDGVTHATYGVPQGWPKTPRDRMPTSNDFYNNDISNVHDDCIEADGNLYNFRVLRNKCVNAAGSAISTQGMAGGPTYIVRNVAYNVPGSFAAIKTSGAPGLLVYNNTFVAALRSSFAPSARSDFRNNLIFAMFPAEPAYSFQFVQGSPTSDYNGYMGGTTAPGALVRPAPPTPRVPGGPAATPAAYKTVAEFSRATGQDKHSRLVDYKIFRNLMPADLVNVTKVYDPATIDFQIKPAGAAADAGALIPGVTDGHRGRAPDLGAYETGAPVPHYGPRP